MDCHYYLLRLTPAASANNKPILLLYLHASLSSPAVATNCSSIQESSDNAHYPQQCWPSFVVRLLPAELAAFASQILLPWVDKLDSTFPPTFRDTSKGT